MKGIKTLVSFTAIAVCLGAASMANAAKFSPDGTYASLASGTIVVKSPSSFGAPVTCGITFSGNVTSGVATVTGASLTGGGLCGVPVLKNIPSPGWVLTATSLTTADASGVGYTIASIPSTNCGPSTLTGLVWDPTAHTLTGSGALSGGCTVSSLTLNVATTPVALTIVP
ncbi:alkane oxidation protein activator PraB [Pseudomonas sp. MWU13-2105]|uniref:alkane oxidation protein activator PraB n=1 Tax=Pseudomonas sp. MWU13-2105 TaxID=2935074 RepID=UPI00200EFB63|nr:alkane oxidation protein activator PraB [Pseudomonas sp. MWU13-2105]